MEPRYKGLKDNLVMLKEQNIYLGFDYGLLCQFYGLVHYNYTINLPLKSKIEIHSLKMAIKLEWLGETCNVCIM